MIEIHPNALGFARLSAALGDIPAKLDKEMAIAINRTANSHRSELNKFIRSLVNMDKAGLKQTIGFNKRATPSSPHAVIAVFKDKRPSLKRHPIPRQTSKGVSYKIAKKGKRGMAAGAFMGPKPGAVARKLGGHAFKRTGKAPGDIVKLHGASPHAFYRANKGPQFSKRKATIRLNIEIKRRIQAVMWKAQKNLNAASRA